jgi:hypothetical protein
MRPRFPESVVYRISAFTIHADDSIYRVSLSTDGVVSAGAGEFRIGRIPARCVIPDSVRSAACRQVVRLERELKLRHIESQLLGGLLQRVVVFRLFRQCRRLGRPECIISRCRETFPGAAFL